ncbi:MAG: DUF4159 domain-containing protein [Phycisphaerae bacterium]|jgi:hypothetical protein|nr:DUF4159 domain-containing protein [Phycisphaerae bacterium]
MRIPFKLISGVAIVGILSAWCGLSRAQTTAPATRPTTRPAALPIYAPPPTPVTPADHAVSRAITFLLKQIDSDGQCAGEFPKGNLRRGGLTALCVYALLSAEVDYRQPEVKRAIQWLRGTKLTGTYAVAMRACAMAACNDKKIEDVLKQDIAWLVRAAGNDGKYGYESANGGEVAEYDNSNAHLAALGVWEGISRLEVRTEPLLRYWRKVRQHWLDQQQIDGGWGYRIRPGALQTRTYGSMTAGGLATLLVCFDTLRREDFVRCTVWREDQPISKALAWVKKNYDMRANPGKGVQWRYYWLFGLSRIGLASGRKFVGGRDWFADGTRQLLGDQNSDGSWGYGNGGQRIPQTAFATLFLARGRRPVLANKLQYPGKWNCRPHDLVNLARHVGDTYERKVTWQIVGGQSEASDFLEAPILYISGAGPCKITDDQADKIRTFVHQGGTIVSEAAGNNGTFTIDMRAFYKRLFPDFALERLDDKHPVYSLQYAPKGVEGLAGVSNGARLLAIHSPRELSLAMQMGTGRKANLPVFELMTNIYLLTTDMGRLPRRGMRKPPLARAFKPLASINLARIKYKGNYDPEPLAWKHLAIWMGNNHRIRLNASDPMEITKLDAKKWPVAAMTGTGSIELSVAEQAALKRYLNSGGKLIVDSCGGDRKFTRAVEQVIGPLVESGRRKYLAGHAILNGPAKIKRVYYRRSLARKLGSLKSQPSIAAFFRDSTPIVIYSQYDLTTGLAGFEGFYMQGYKPQSAMPIMTNLLCNAAGVKIGSPDPSPATSPKDR